MIFPALNGESPDSEIIHSRFYTIQSMYSLTVFFHNYSYCRFSLYAKTASFEETLCILILHFCSMYVHIIVRLACFLCKIVDENSFPTRRFGICCSFGPRQFSSTFLNMSHTLQFWNLLHGFWRSVCFFPFFFLDVSKATPSEAHIIAFTISEKHTLELIPRNLKVLDKELRSHTILDPRFGHIEQRHRISSHSRLQIV